MSYRMTSSPDDPTPSFVCDTLADLQAILEDATYNEQGTTAVTLTPFDVYILSGDRTWIKL